MLSGGAWARPSPAPLRFRPGVRLSKTQLSLMTAPSAEHSAAPPVLRPVTPRCAPATGSADGCSQPRRVRDASAPAASFAATGVCWPRATSGPRRGRRAADVCGHKNVALKCPTSGHVQSKGCGAFADVRQPESPHVCVRASPVGSCFLPEDLRRCGPRQGHVLRLRRLVGCSSAETGHTPRGGTAWTWAPVDAMQAVPHSVRLPRSHSLARLRNGSFVPVTWS